MEKEGCLSRLSLLVLPALIVTGVCQEMFGSKYTHPLGIKRSTLSYDGNTMFLADSNYLAMFFNRTSAGFVHFASIQLTQPQLNTARRLYFNPTGDKILTIGDNTSTLIQLDQNGASVVWSHDLRREYSRMIYLTDYSRIYAAVYSKFYRLENFTSTSFS